MMSTTLGHFISVFQDGRSVNTKNVFKKFGRHPKNRKKSMYGQIPKTW